MTVPSEAYLIGVDDRLDNKARHDCPYEDHTDEACDWCEGWDDTDEDMKEEGD